MRICEWVWVCGWVCSIASLTSSVVLKFVLDVFVAARSENKFSNKLGPQQAKFGRFHFFGRDTRTPRHTTNHTARTSNSKEQATARSPAHPAHPDPTSMASLAQAPLAALPVHNWVRVPEPMHNWVRAELVAPPKSPAPPPSPPSPPPPATLVLSGELTDQGSCLGVYSLLDVQVHGGEHPY